MNKIKYYRKKINITQENLAQALNISQGAISHYESGKRDVDLETCRKIAGFFVISGVNTSIDDIFPPKQTINKSNGK